MISASPIVVAALIALIMLTVIAAYWMTVQSTITEPKYLPDRSVTYLKDVAQVIGGGALIGTFIWTVIKDSETLSQAERNASNLQYIAAAQLIAKDKDVGARAAGNYAFGKVAAAFPDYFDPVANTLKVFIQENKPADADPGDGKQKPLVGKDIGAATYVLGRLPIPDDREYQLRDFYLAGADFSASTAFRRADFQGAILVAANFTWANLTNAKFNGARMEDWIAYGFTRDWDARMTSANDTNEYWWGWERYRYIVNFDHAILIKSSFEDTSVAGASFRYADLDGASFTRSDISRADFRDAINLAGANLEGACFGRSGTDAAKRAQEPLGLPKELRNSLARCDVTANASSSSVVDSAPK